MSRYPQMIRQVKRDLKREVFTDSDIRHKAYVAPLNKDQLSWFGDVDKEVTWKFHTC